MDFDDFDDRLYNDILKDIREEDREKRQKKSPKYNTKAIIELLAFFGSFGIAEFIEDLTTKVIFIILIYVVTFIYVTKR